MRTSRVIGGLFVVSGLLGVFLLLSDPVLRIGAPQHYDALIAFVVIDFLLGGLEFLTLRSLLVRVAAIWSVVRILLQLGDVFLGPMYQFTYAQFADYLFNPMSSVPATVGNPAGIPSIPIDLILLIDFAVLFIALSQKHSASSS
ncbi:MAG: hypothetical protein ACLP5V_11105 [Candidatus Bathyarchaeia archaeon]